MRRWLFALAAVLVPALLHAQEVKLPEGVKPIATDELKGMLDRRENVVLINSLSALEFTQTKIAGSMNIPYGHLLDGKRNLPGHKEVTTLAFYCLGPK